MRAVLFIMLIFQVSAEAFSQDFDRTVHSKDLRVECDADPADERGPFGIAYQEGLIRHDFLVMTGVYYDTCMDLEKRIKKLQSTHPQLILRGSGKTIYQPNNHVWRWRSIRPITGKGCVSYFEEDCGP